MTPCAASRTQTCARTFSKDFTVRSSGVSLRVFHRRTRWCKPSQQHAHTRKPSARPSRSRRRCLHCSALHSHSRTHPAHTCTPIRRARIFAVSCRRARCLRNPVVLARLRLLAGGRQRCAETAVRMAECVSRSGWTVAAPKVQTCSAQRLTMWSAGRTVIFCTTRVASNAPHLRTLSRCLNACTSPARTCLGQLLLPGPHCLSSAQSAIPRDRFTVRFVTH